VYGELRLPILKNLEAQLAARYDHYSDYGSSTVPKIGLKYTPTDMVALRGNLGKGFRAPTLPEISPSTATFFVQVIDPQTDTTQQISGVFAGNPNLKAEKSTSANLGIVFEPSRNFSTSLDYYWIKWKDIVLRLTSRASSTRRARTRRSATRPAELPEHGRRSCATRSRTTS
jgi:iron complex outermembrane receptor protein